MDEKSRGAVIVAAGRGTRMGEDKVWLPLGGLPVVGHSLRAFAACEGVSRLVLVVAEDRLEAGNRLLGQMGIRGIVSPGGPRRQDSVMRGLEALGAVDLVAIHDGARPFVSARLIDACYHAAARDGGAAAAIPVRDTIKRVDGDGWVAETLSREGLWAVQTPQTFRTELIKAAYRSLDREVTDDAAALELMGGRVAVVPGDPANMKLTTREDLIIGEALFERLRQ